jgi:hypothetical protein
MAWPHIQTSSPLFFEADTFRLRLRMTPEHQHSTSLPRIRPLNRASQLQLSKPTPQLHLNNPITLPVRTYPHPPHPQRLQRFQSPQHAPSASGTTTSAPAQTIPCLQPTNPPTAHVSIYTPRPTTKKPECSKVNRIGIAKWEIVDLNCAYSAATTRFRRKKS